MFAVVLAVLGAIDSLLTSLVADSLTSDFHDSDKELRGDYWVAALLALMHGTCAQVDLVWRFTAEILRSACTRSRHW